MYLPRSLIGKLYSHLVRSRHLLSPTILILVALEPDALCACRILTTLLKRDYIPHKIKPVAGYADLANAGRDLVQPMRTSDGGAGGVVICLGVGGLIDLEQILGLEVDEHGEGGAGDIEVWVMDARRPWNLANVFGGLPQDPSEDPNEPNATVGIDKGRITHNYTPGKGGIIVFDDGDIEGELSAEQEAYWALAEMPEVDDDDNDGEELSDEGEEELELPPSGQGQKRKSTPDRDDTDSEEETAHPRRKRRSNSSEAIVSSPGRQQRSFSTASSDVSKPPSVASGSSSPTRTERPSVHTLRRRLRRMRHKHQKTLGAYQGLGTSYSEPVSSLAYSLASELGREDNDLLWHAIIGVSSMELYGRSLTGVGVTCSEVSGWDGDRAERIRDVLRDEVRRLNPSDPQEWTREQYMGDLSRGGIPTNARSPTDSAIRLSPEPRFLLIRHWSLYDSMLHSPYLAARLRVWSESGKRRLHKLLAKMGISLVQCRQTYTHMDMDLKRELRDKLLKCGPLYGLEDLAPPVRGPGDRQGWGFVRCWGWKACLSATDVAVIVGSILEVGDPTHDQAQALAHRSRVTDGDAEAVTDGAAKDAIAQEAVTARFFKAYDALGSVDKLMANIQTAQHLHRAILRTGSALIEKRQIRHLRAFRMAVVREGPDVELFTHPGALVKLALWLAEAIEEKEGRKRGKRGEELLVAGLDESRGVYVVVGLGGGGAQSAKKLREREEKLAAKEKRREEKRAERERKRAEKADDEDAELETEEEESDNSDSDSDDEIAQKRPLRNRFGNAFQEVIDETGTRVRVDSFEHCVVEVKKEDLSGFLESLSMKTVVA